MKESLLRAFFVVMITLLLCGQYACTPTAQRLDDLQGAARLPAQSSLSVNLASADLPATDDPAAAPAPNTHNPEGGRPEFTRVVLEQLDIMQHEGFPVLVNARLSGYTENVCQGFNDIIEYQDKNTFRLELFPASSTQTCDKQQPFEIIVPLSVDGLSAGIYRVEALDKMTEFEIPIDNYDMVGFTQSQ